MSGTKSSPESPFRDERRGRLTVFYTDWNPGYRDKARSRGLINELTVVCYRNCILTALLHQPVFVNWLELHLEEFCNVSGKGQVCLACHLASFSREYWSDGEASQLSRSLARVWEACSTFWDHTSVEQEDCIEFLNALLHHIASGSNGDVEGYGGLLGHMFQSIVKHRTTCESCKQVKDSAKDPSYIIGANPPRERERKMEACIEEYMGNNVIEGYKCESCNQVSNVSRRAYIRDAPEILIVQINRFGQVQLGKETRLTARVAFDEDLDLTSHLEPYAVRSGETLHYQLTTVIVHRGNSIKNGHYMALVKGPTGQWTNLDDEAATEVDINAVLGCHRGRVLPYVLIYNRKPYHPWPPGASERSSDPDGIFSVEESQESLAAGQAAIRSTATGTSSDQLSETAAETNQTQRGDESAQVQLGANLDLPELPDYASSMGTNDDPPISFRWEGQPAEITVQVTMGDMVLTGVLKGLLKKGPKRPGIGNHKRDNSGAKPVGITKHRFSSSHPSTRSAQKDWQTHDSSEIGSNDILAAADN